MRELLHDAAARASAYLDGVDRRPVFPATLDLEPLGGSLPPGPSEPREALALLDRVGSPATVASAGGRYFGFVTGGSYPVAVAASWLATAWDQNNALWVMSPVAAQLETTVLRWLVELFGLPSDCDGGLVTGTTTANFTALIAARRALLLRRGWDVEDRGLCGAPPLRVVAGDEVHASMLKAVAMAGLGRGRVERVPTDEQGRLRPDKMPRLDDTTILCLQAGNVNTGASDPMAATIARARAAGAWVHVDGAFGLWAAAHPGLADQVRGVEQADSWATDLHKWLNVPYDAGAVLVRDAANLRAAMGASAAYLIERGPREGMHHVPESSRRARAVEAWAVLRSLGQSGVVELLDRCCRLARRFAAGLREAGFEVLNDVVLNQVLARIGDDERTRRIAEAVQADGTCWAGTTVWHGKAAIRISVSSWATSEADVDRSIESMARHAKRG
jgi:glutamate/tyrosine decarboxylase-like PLP-dependent enzyme